MRQRSKPRATKSGPPSWLILPRSLSPAVLRSTCRPQDSRFIRGIPIFQRSDGGILVIGSQADQGAAEQENRDEQKLVVITDLIGIDIRDKKVNKKRRGKAESSHGNALDE